MPSKSNHSPPKLRGRFARPRGRAPPPRPRFRTRRPPFFGGGRLEGWQQARPSRRASFETRRKMRRSSKDEVRGANSRSEALASGASRDRKVPMSLWPLYARVLSLLGPETRLGVFLAIANFALAGAQFAEPVLFGRIIDALAGSQGS